MVSFLQLLKEQLSGFHLFSFNLPIRSRCNWATWVKARVVVDFVCFILLLWVVYCPAAMLGEALTQVQTVELVVIMVVFVLDALLSFFAVQTQYMNWAALVYPVNMLCIVTRRAMNERYQNMISLGLLCATHCVVFAASAIHVLVIYVFHANDVKLDG